MIRIRITFQKTDSMRYIGHLDLYHTWIRTFRRAHLQVVHSQGFHPQPKIHLASALSLGYTGSREYLECWFDHDQPVDEIRARLEPAMHPYLKLVDVEEVDLKAEPMQVRICGAEYLVQLPERYLPDLQQKIDNLLAQPEIIVERRGKQINIRPWIFEARLDPQKSELTLNLSAGEGTTGRVDEVLEQLLIDPLDCLVDRTRIELK